MQNQDDLLTPRALSPANSLNDKEKNPFYDGDDDSNDEKEEGINQRESKFLFSNSTNKEVSLLTNKDKIDGTELNSSISAFSTQQKVVNLNNLIYNFSRTH